MKYVNIKRQLLGRLALENSMKNKEHPVRTVHLNTLLLIFELKKNEMRGVSGSQLNVMMNKVRRGSHFHHLKGILTDLYSFGLIDYYKNGRIRRYSVTAEGMLYLNDFEKGLRIVRVDRRILNPKNIKHENRKETKIQNQRKRS